MEKMNEKNTSRTKATEKLDRSTLVLQANISFLISGSVADRSSIFSAADTVVHLWLAVKPNRQKHE